MLQKVSIQNFKSLKDITLELQKVNLLIGPNNSGKSNFLKALDIKNSIGIFKQGIERGDFSNLMFRKNNSNNLLISLSFQTETKNEQLIISGDSKFLTSSLGYNFIGIIEDSGIIEYHSLEYYFYDTNIYKPDPNKLQKPFPILPNQSFVNSDASNLVAFLDILQGRYRESFVAIENDLNKCIPEFSRIELDPVEITKDDDLFKIYGDKTFKRLGLYDKNNKLTYWADELSEGTLYFLALLCIVHQPNPPKLLLLEEPEKGIHPRRIHEVMKFIFQLAEDKDIQVIMTSHNEHVLEEFSLLPEAVFIFDKDEEGATFVKNLQKDIIEPDTLKAKEFGIEPIDYTDRIGENWFMGLMGGVPA